MSSYKVCEVREFGVEQLAFGKREFRAPGSHEILVKLQAASLNYRDYRVVLGKYNPKMRRPMIPLSDGAGTVEEVGSAVTQFKKGDRVAGCFFESWAEGPITSAKSKTALGGAVDGVLSEYRLFSQDGLVAIPPHLSYVEAAALPCAAVTAWHALFEQSPLAPGETVLLQGTGGVSVFALQFALAAGMRTIVTSSSEEKLERARELGAHATINYKLTPDWDAEARKLSNGEGVDKVIEVGGSDTMPKSLRAVKMAGAVSVIGILSGGDPTVSPAPILMNSLRVQGVYVGSRLMFERMNRAIELHQIKPVVDRVFPWNDIKQALGHMESQRHFGKICLEF